MNQRRDFVITECYVDTNLIETLVCPTGCNHQKGCNQVTKLMMEKFANRFAIGIIDDDKRKPSYLNNFTEIASNQHLKLFKHTKLAHYIILVSPAIDGFIISCSKEYQIKMENFGLASELKYFMSQTKDVISNKDTRFKNLFKAMKEAKDLVLLKKNERLSNRNKLSCI